MPFEAERKGFSRFRAEVTKKPIILRELVKAVSDVYEKYGTSIRENRFITGGAIEFIVGSALRAAGVDVHHKGASSAGNDLVFDSGEGGYSVKAILLGSSTRLINTLGAAANIDYWKTATLFLISGGAGIVYADPALPWWVANKAEFLRAQGDALSIKKRGVAEFAAAQSAYAIACSFPNKPGTGAVQIASADVAGNVLYRYPTLFKEFPALRPGEEMKQGKLTPDD